MTKLSTTPVQSSTNSETSAAPPVGATPVQFLPSTMLSWRMPIMASSGLPANRVREPVTGYIVSQQRRLNQPIP